VVSHRSRPLPDSPNTPEVHPHLPIVWSVISRFGAGLRLCDVRAVTCMVHITRLDLDQISMPVVMDHSWRWCSMPFSQQSTASPRRHATVTPVPDHCSTLACRCLSGKCQSWRAPSYPEGTTV
jgi:hypothetical protein